MEIITIKELRYNKAIKDLMINDHNGTWDEILEFEAEGSLDRAYELLIYGLECCIENNEDDPDSQEFYKNILKSL